jgi:hypothetical protein
VRGTPAVERPIAARWRAALIRDVSKGDLFSRRDRFSEMRPVSDGAVSFRWCVSPDCHCSRCASACVASRGNTFSRRSSRACACCRRARWRGCASGRSARARSSHGSVMRSSSASDLLNVRCTWFSDATPPSSDAVTSRITNLASARLAPDAATRVDGRLVWPPWASSSFCPCHGLLLDHPCTFLLR